MIWTDYIIMAFIQLIIATLLGFWLKNYWPSYFSQKGKNLADKEDIEDLTLKIEEVKTEFNKDLELFKSKIDFDKTKHLSYHEEEKRVLIEFHGKISEWAIKLFSINFSDFKSMNALMIKDMLDRLDMFADISLYLSRVRLLIENGEVIDSSVKLSQKAIWYQREVVKRIEPIQLKLFTYNSYIEKLEEIIPKITDTSYYLNDLTDTLGKEEKELNELIDKYMNGERLTLYQQFQTIEDSFISSVRNVIKGNKSIPPTNT